MGLMDFLLGAADVLDTLSGPKGKKYDVECDSLELFEIVSTWRGTAHIHEAGVHVKTIKVSASTTLFLPDKSENSQYTERGLLRRDMREWVGEEFALSGKISRDMVVLNTGENCLSVEGFVNQVDGKWKIVNDAEKGTYYGSYKLRFTEKGGEPVRHQELYHLFMADTIGIITSVDVQDGF